MSAVLDRVLLGVDLLLVGGVVAAGTLGESIPLPKGLDALSVAAPPAAPKPPPVPAPPPEPPPAPEAPPEPPPAPEPPKPGTAEWGRAMQARDRARALMGQAHEAPIHDPGRKRKAYTEAEEALKEALRELEACKALRPESAAALDEEATKLRSLIQECHKSKPMEIK